MLKRNRLMCLTLLPIFMTPSTVTPFQNQAWQHIEKQVDNNEMVFQTNEIGLIKTDLEIQLDKDRLEFEKQKERLRKQKELEEQKRNEPEWQEQIFILTYYGATYNECGNTKFITASGIPVNEGHIAVPKEIPFGSKIMINGNEYIATDRGNPKYICILKDGSIRVDIFISRINGESISQYEKRIAKMGTQKVNGKILIKE